MNDRPAPTVGHSMSFDWTAAYPSRRQPIFARNAVAPSQRYGKLPFADLFASAIGYAREGYAVSPVVADKWAKAVPILGSVPGFAEHFLPRGRAPEPGERFASSALAASLEKIAATK